MPLVSGVDQYYSQKYGRVSLIIQNSWVHISPGEEESSYHAQLKSSDTSYDIWYNQATAILSTYPF